MPSRAAPATPTTTRLAHFVTHDSGSGGGGGEEEVKWSASTGDVTVIGVAVGERGSAPGGGGGAPQLAEGGEG